MKRQPTEKSSPEKVSDQTPASLPAQYLTIGQAALTLALSQSSIRRWITAGQLPHFRIGKQIRIDPRDLARFITSKRRA